MIPVMKNKEVSSNDSRCTKCRKYKPRYNFLKSEGGICDTCFEPYEEILKLEVDSPVFYCSPITGTEEEMIISKKGHKSHQWHIGVKRLSQKHDKIEGVIVPMKYVKPFYQGDEKQLVECVSCKKETPLNELEDNARLGSYGFKMICDTCSDEIDRAIDAQQQDKA